MKYILSIAGSDSIGGAGIQADIRTITCLKAHPLTALTAVTAQNSMDVTEIHPLPPKLVARQLETILSDQSPDSVKIGMLHNRDIVREVAAILERIRPGLIVLDPVMKASTGKKLLDPEGVPLLIDTLLPLVRVVTPNLDEAGIIIGQQVINLEDMVDAAREIKAMGPDVVITGGHMKGDIIDLFYDGHEFRYFQDERIDTRNTHGSGCVFSTSLAVFLAMNNNMADAVNRAHAFTREAIIAGYPCGRGAGTLNPYMVMKVEKEEK